MKSRTLPLLLVSILLMTLNFVGKNYGAAQAAPQAGGLTGIFFIEQGSSDYTLFENGRSSDLKSGAVFIGGLEPGQYTFLFESEPGMVVFQDCEIYGFQCDLNTNYALEITSTEQVINVWFTAYFAEIPGYLSVKLLDPQSTEVEFANDIIYMDPPLHGVYYIDQDWPVHAIQDVSLELNAGSHDFLLALDDPDLESGTYIASLFVNGESVGNQGFVLEYAGQPQSVIKTVDLQIAGEIQMKLADASGSEWLQLDHEYISFVLNHLLYMPAIFKP